ncbi:MAG: DUF192 domain-containing protein [Candidatus Eremiobacteraeota bacterium]|nr:DUF192 domain-containing protein [Candidatus Eremiobacteraeota bacterium]
MSVRLRFARTPWSRAIGLLGRRSFPADCALVIEGCDAIHTWFMAMAIDVAFIDEHYRVVALHERVAAGRVLRHPGAFAVVELGAGAAQSAGLTTGSMLTPI